MDQSFPESGAPSPGGVDVGFQRWRGMWCMVGLAAALPVFIVLSFAVGWLLRRGVASVPATVGLSVLPLQVGATTVLLGVLAFACYLRKVRFVETLELTCADFGRHAKTAFLTWAWVYPVALALGMIGAGVGHLLGRPPQENPILELLVDAVPTTWLVVFFAVAVLAPITEELLFRLALQESLACFMGRYAVLPVALIFSVSHGIPEQVPALFVLSVALQRARERTGSLWTPILVHALFNATALLLLLIAMALKLELHGM